MRLRTGSRSAAAGPSTSGLPPTCRFLPALLQRVIDFYGAKPEGKLTLLLDDSAAKGEQSAAPSGCVPCGAAGGKDRCVLGDAACTYAPTG